MKKVLQQGWVFWFICLWLPMGAAAQDEDSTFIVLDSSQKVIDTAVPSQRQSLIKRLVNRYTTDTVAYAKKGIVIKPSLTFGVGYRIQKSRTGREPFDSEHSLTFNYVINRGGFFIQHSSLWYEAIGSWNLGLTARVDLPDVVNFHGIGNESVWNQDLKSRYYRLRTSELFGGISINKLVDSAHFFELQPFYHSVKIKLDDDRIISDRSLDLDKTDFTRDHFAGTRAGYMYSRKNNDLAPSRGFEFALSGAYVHNLKNTDRHFTQYNSYATAYLPLHRRLTLALRAGGAALQGDPEFYQLAMLGGSENLRGYRRQRFWGKTAFYNNNELRWLKPTSSKLFSQVGLLAFVDQGRVWQPGEASDTWHVGYGGGLVIIPYNRIVLNGSVGTSKEATIIHLRIGYLF